MRRELLIGCGRARDKRLSWGSSSWDNLTTLDLFPEHKPDVVFDLTTIQHGKRLPFADDWFDEIHAYEVLEHIGQQGDWRAFFAQFGEFHRILRHGGIFAATCPSYRSMWAWGDPSHTRVITSGTLAFLDQEQYRKQVGHTSMSDFRPVYRAHFDILHCKEDDGTLAFILRAMKHDSFILEPVL